MIETADPDAVGRAAGEFLLALEEDADRPRRDGRAFEAMAIEELRKMGQTPTP